MLCPEELVIAVNTLSVLISKQLSNQQLGILAAILTQIGDTLATIAVQRELIEQCCNSKSEDIDII